MHVNCILAKNGYMQKSCQNAFFRTCISYTLFLTVVYLVYCIEQHSTSGIKSRLLKPKLFLDFQREDQIITLPILEELKCYKLSLISTCDYMDYLARLYIQIIWQTFYIEYLGRLIYRISQQTSQADFVYWLTRRTFSIN